MICPEFACKSKIEKPQMENKLTNADSNLHSITEELHKVLADEVILFIKNKNYYWNIEAENFFEMRHFYKLHSDQLEEIIEMTANLIRIFGSQTQTRLADYISTTNLMEQPYTNFTRDQLKYLVASHETIINNLRRLAGVFNSKNNKIEAASFASRILLRHEKLAWMLRSSLSSLPKNS